MFHSLGYIYYKCHSQVYSEKAPPLLQCWNTLNWSQKVDAVMPPEKICVPVQLRHGVHLQGQHQCVVGPVLVELLKTH